jgi:hypothetical protein
MTAATAYGYTAVGVITAGFGAYAASILAGHQRLACLRRAVAVRALIAATLASIAAVYAWRTIRHPLRYARYLAARAVRRIPRRDPDGEPLDRDEMRAFIAAVESWRHDAPPERTRT